MASSVAGQVGAQRYVCEFPRSCYQQENCARERLHDGTLSKDGDVWLWDSGGSGALPLRAVSGPDGPHFALVSEYVADSVSIFSIFADGSARQTYHFFYNDARSITYHGTCEAAE